MVDGLRRFHLVRTVRDSWRDRVIQPISDWGSSGPQVQTPSLPVSLPGRIATPRVRQINEAAAARSGIPVADVEQNSTGETPAGRYGEPDGFGAVAAFLCSAPASYVTGAALRCDGGLVPTL